MRIIPFQARSSSHQTKRVLRSLLKRLRTHYNGIIRNLRHLSESPEEIEALMMVSQQASQIRKAAIELLCDLEALDPIQARKRLQQLSADVLTHLMAQPYHHHSSRQKLTELMNILNSADKALAEYAPCAAPNQPLAVEASTDLLYQAFMALFPAERMLIASGRRTGTKVSLTAMFDVTGASSLGHVSADPAALGRSLMAMENTGSYMAAWLHSHPGSGIASTFPSHIDFDQHQDWIKDYSSNLISVIFVQDGWMRLWGTAVEQKQVHIVFHGEGLIKMEDNDGYIYRLAI
jgi:hypothetical protein